MSERERMCRKSGHASRNAAVQTYIRSTVLLVCLCMPMRIRHPVLFGSHRRGAKSSSDCCDQSEGEGRRFQTQCDSFWKRRSKTDLAHRLIASAYAFVRNIVLCVHFCVIVLFTWAHTLRVINLPVVRLFSLTHVHTF